MLAEGGVAEASLLLYQLRHFESARASTATLLALIQTSQAAIGDWTLVWYFLGCLRDCAVLPKELVLEVDTDLLPPHIREDFELALLDIDRKAFDQQKPVAPKKVKRQTSSLLSLQGLGEALFGGAEPQDDAAADSSSRSAEGGAADTSESYNADLADFKHVFKLDAVSARWDAGYEFAATGGGAASPGPLGAGEEGAGVGFAYTGAPPSQPNSPVRSAAILQQKGIPAFSIVDGGMTVEELRCGAFLVFDCPFIHLLIYVQN